MTIICFQRSYPELRIRIHYGSTSPSRNYIDCVQIGSELNLIIRRSRSLWSRSLHYRIKICCWQQKTEVRDYFLCLASFEVSRLRSYSKSVASSPRISSKNSTFHMLATLYDNNTDESEIHKVTVTYNIQHWATILFRTVLTYIILQICICKSFHICT